MRHTFTIIVSVLNSASTLQRCIDSVINQTYPYKELIIMDGESIDGTVEILQINDNSIDYWESKKDSGVYNAWNKGLDHANGDWIYFLGADDYLFSHSVLEGIAHELDKLESKYKLVYGVVCIINEDGKIIFNKGEPWEKYDQTRSHSMVMPHQGVFHHRDIFEEHGRFDESFLVCGDIDFLFKVLKHNEPYFLPGLTIAAKSYYGISSNPKNKLLILKEVYKARRNNGLKSITLLWLFEYSWALSLGFLQKIVGRKGVRNIIKSYCKLTNQPPYWEKY